MTATNDGIFHLRGRIEGGKLVALLDHQGAEIGGPVTSKTNPLTGGVRTSSPISLNRAERLLTGIFGDSIIATYGNGDSGGKSILGRLFAQCGQPFSVIHEGGVGGESGAQILARIKAQVTLGRFDVVFIEMGTNTLNAMSGTANANVTNIYSLYQQAIDHCISQSVPYIFVVGMFPFDPATPGWAAANLKTVQPRVNSLLEAYCKKRSCCYLDGYSAVVGSNGVDASITPIRTYTYYHPNNNAAALFAKTNAPYVKQFLKLTGNPVAARASGYYATDIDSAQLCPNPLMYGNAGTKPNGATGTVPSNYTVLGYSIGTSLCDCSIVPANFGSGFAARLSITANDTASQWKLSCGSAEGLIDINNGVKFVSPGDSFYLECYVKTTGAVGVLKGLAVSGSYVVTGGSLNGTTQYFYALSSNASLDQILEADIAEHFMSPNIVVPADCTSILINNISAQTTAAGISGGSCVVDFEKLSLVKI